MPTFAYSAHGPTGIITGEIAAADRAEALTLLGKKRLCPFRLEQSGTAAPVKKVTQTSPAADGPIKLKPQQILLFTEELSDLLSAGIQLEPALATMERRRELSGVKALATALRAKVRDGLPFSKAIAAASPSFGGLYCALANAGEASGTLPAILKRQVEYLRSLAALRSKVLFALIYPAFLVVAAVAVTLLFVVYLIPQLMELMDSTGGALPVAAQMILKFSEFLKATWWMILMAVLAVFVVAKAWLKRPEAQIPWACFQLRLPLFGEVLRTRFFVQMLETMANLLGNGLSMVQAMQLTQQAIENPYFRREFERIMNLVAEGMSLSRALDRSGLFPPLLLDMVNVGEQTGDMAGALAKAAQRFDRDLGKKIEKLTALAQPAIVFLMAGLVGTMAYLMMTAIFQTIGNISK
ncbi:MAG: type II secretion system F family protein [Prosthecobacter sp.]|jgi:type II secretory pathway component PulF|nr:type II secretion system F family protein [Prosthecobacter sp.]